MSLAMLRALSGRRWEAEGLELAITERRPGDPANLLRTLRTVDLTGDDGLGLAGVLVLSRSKTLPRERAMLLDGLVGGADLPPDLDALLGVLKSPDRVRRRGVGVPGSALRVVVVGLTTMSETRAWRWWFADVTSWITASVSFSAETKELTIGMQEVTVKVKAGASPLTAVERRSVGAGVVHQIVRRHDWSGWRLGHRRLGHRRHRRVGA